MNLSQPEPNWNPGRTSLWRNRCLSIVPLSFVCWPGKSTYCTMFYLTKHTTRQPEHLIPNEDYSPSVISPSVILSAAKN